MAGAGVTSGAGNAQRQLLSDSVQTQARHVNRELFAKLTFFRGYTECIAVQPSVARHITVAIGIGIE